MGNFKSILGAMFIILVSISETYALNCPGQTGTNPCNGAPATSFVNNILCLASPKGRAANSSSTIDDEVSDTGICLLGKFRTAQDLMSLADFVVSYEMLPSSTMPTPQEDVFTLPAGVFSLDFDTLRTGGGEFQTVLPLVMNGTYDVTVQASVVSGGSLTPVSINRRVISVASPYLTVKNARVPGALPPPPGTNRDDNCTTPTPGPYCLKVNDATAPVSQGGPRLPRVIDVTPPSTVQTKMVEFCLNGITGINNDTGTEVFVRAVNTVSDSSSGLTKTAQVTATCGDPTTLGDPLIPTVACPLSSDSFCPGGFEIKVPVGNGSNQIDLYVKNVSPSEQRIRVNTFTADLKGPDLCVSYLDENDVPVPGVDGKVLLEDEASNVKLDVTLGKCGQPSESVSYPANAICNPENPLPCGTFPVCVQMNNKNSVALCPQNVAGKTRFQARFPQLRFPGNTATIKAVDNLKNVTLETHTFAYGTVMPLFDQQGSFNLQSAMIPNAVGGFVPANAITGSLLQDILRVVNSQEFKNKIFPQLLDPREPDPLEVSCLNQLERQAGCEYKHLTNGKTTTTIKLLCNNGQCNKIGNFELSRNCPAPAGQVGTVPCLYLLNNNTIWVQLKLKGLREQAEMYTMQFIDTDGDGLVDTEDDDDDCAKGNTTCEGQELDEDAADDDGDGVPDENDLPGILVNDPDFGIKIIPLRMAIKEMALNLQITFRKAANGKMVINITNVPGKNLVDIAADRDLPIEFDCTQNYSGLFSGGGVDTPFNGQRWALYPDRGTCQSMESLSKSKFATEIVPKVCWNPLDWFDCDEGESNLVDVRQRKNQGVYRQLQCTLAAVTRCSLPKRIESTLNKFEKEKVTGLSLDLFDETFSLDLFAPLGSANISVDPKGLGFSGRGIVLPAGVTAKGDTSTTPDAIRFMKALPGRLGSDKVFGAISDYDKFGPVMKPGGGKSVEPEDAAYGMPGELNLAINELSINSALHGLAMLLWDEASNPKNDAKQVLDLSTKRIREDFGLAIPDSGQTSTLCLDKDGNTVSPNSYKCFPFGLNLDNILGASTITYVDFNENKKLGAEDTTAAILGEIGGADALVPVILRINMNPHSPPVAKINKISQIFTTDNSGNSGVRAPFLNAELEVNLGNGTMTIFEEEVLSWATSKMIKGTGVIKDWCDQDRFPRMGPGNCNVTDRKDKKLLPIVRFNVSGYVTVQLKIEVKDDGILRIEGGIAGKPGASNARQGQPMIADTSKTYLDFTVLENNTISQDADLVTNMKEKVDLILNEYVYGNDRDIKINIPAQVPLEAFCSQFGSEPLNKELCDCVADPTKSDCGLVSSIKDLWDDLGLEKYNVNGATLTQPGLAITPDDLGLENYLLLGAGLNLQ